MSVLSVGGSVFDSDKLQSRIEEIRSLITDTGFWDDVPRANKLMKELKMLENKLNSWNILRSRVDTLDEVGEVLSDEEMQAEIEKIESDLKQAELLLFFSRKYDENDALISIHPGAGGTDAQDFAEMLLRMYLRLCERKNWKVELLDKSTGDEAGIKSATLKISGEYVFGWLKAENGVHRLVRQSPFNSSGTRETSFAQVEIMPVVESEDLRIDEKDLRVDTYRASGKGGQGVNTTDSAVRITHLPTGIVTTCQNERSQIQNKEKALEVLKSRLAQMMEEQHTSKLEELRGEKQQIAWSNQIRSYVLHPYKMVKDHRTGTESGNPDKIFDGELDEFLESGLKIN